MYLLMASIGSVVILAILVFLIVDFKTDRLESSQIDEILKSIHYHKDLRYYGSNGEFYKAHNEDLSIIITKQSVGLALVKVSYTDHSNTMVSLVGLNVLKDYIENIVDENGNQ